MLVFCEFTETARLLSSALEGRRTFMITGELPVWRRSEVLDAFREAADGILVMTSVGSEGLDLQSCSVLVNYDLTWNPMRLEQRIGRVDRIGQPKPEVTVHNFVVSGSIWLRKSSASEAWQKTVWSAADELTAVCMRYA
jgi:SNF2 family DNA or RNA helicase